MKLFELRVAERRLKRFPRPHNAIDDEEHSPDGEERAPDS